jgi:hypothetical protein
MVLPIKRTVVTPVCGCHSGPDETGKTPQEAKRHRASSEPARFKNPADDLALMARETKSLAGRCGGLAKLDYFLEFVWATAEGQARRKRN